MKRMLSLPVMLPPTPPFSPTGHDTDMPRSMWPQLGCSMPAISRISVDLPAPLRPRTASFSPRAIEKSNVAQHPVIAAPGLRAVILADRGREIIDTPSGRQPSARPMRARARRRPAARRCRRPAQTDRDDRHERHDALRIERIIGEIGLARSSRDRAAGAALRAARLRARRRPRRAASRLAAAARRAARIR